MVCDCHFLLWRIIIFWTLCKFEMTVLMVEMATAVMAVMATTVMAVLELSVTPSTATQLLRQPKWVHWWRQWMTTTVTVAMAAVVAVAAVAVADAAVASQMLNWIKFVGHMKICAVTIEFCKCQKACDDCTFVHCTHTEIIIQFCWCTVLCSHNTESYWPFYICRK